MNLTAAGPGSDIYLSAGGNIFLGGPSVTAPDQITLVTPGDIVDGNRGLTVPTDLTAGGLVTLTARSVGQGDPLETIIESLSATLNGGGLSIRNGNNSGILTVRSVHAPASIADVHIVNAGTLQLGTITAGRSVTLDATTIVDLNGSSNNVSTQTFSLFAQNGAGTISDPLETSVARLNVNANGSVFLSEANGLTVDKVIVNGAGNDFFLTNATGDLVLGTLIVADECSLTATLGAVVDGNDVGSQPAVNITANRATLRAGRIIGTANNILELNVPTANRTLSAPNGVFVSP